MTSFDISESVAFPALSQYYSQRPSDSLANCSAIYSAKAAGMRDPIRLVKAHLSFLAGEFVAQAALTAESFAKGMAERVCFTAIDQAFILWGVASAVIFSVAQFSLLSWATQSVIDAAITGVCIACSAQLTWQIAKAENLRWIIFLWAILMAGGMMLTTYGIFCGVSAILIDLCPLWLGLCTVGYTIMGIKMRSHSFTAAALIHGVSIFSVSLVPSWQFLASGLVMALTLFFFSVVPWDMRTVPATGEPC